MTKVQTFAACLCFLIPAVANADLVVITDSFGIPNGRGGATIGWPEQLDAEVIGNPGRDAWRAVYRMRFYPNRHDFTGDTVVLALGIDEARRGDVDLMAWQAQMTYLAHQSIALGAERVLIPYLPEPPGPLGWRVSLFNWGYRSLCTAIPRQSNPRAEALPIWCGMMTFGFDFYGPDNDTHMTQEGHDQFARLLARRLGIGQ